MSCIYVLTNKINGKKYVGQTSRSFDFRLKKHLSCARNKNKLKISRAINKYGIDNFEKYIYECQEEDLDYLETEMIKILDSINNGYNLETGGSKNKHHSEETKKKMSISKKGAPNGWLGKHHSKETRKKQSEAHEGNKNSMYGVSLAGEKNGMYGKGYLQVGSKNPMYGKRPWNKKD
jgi:group I intron endonuclease